MDRRPNRRNKAAFSNFSSLKSVFDKFSFSDGLVWKVGLTRRKKTAFSNFYGVVWTMRCSRYSCQPGLSKGALCKLAEEASKVLM